MAHQTSNVAQTLTIWSTGLVLLGVCMCQDIYQLENHLERLTQIRNPVAPNDARGTARSYIRGRMQQYGLKLHLHTFNTTVNINGNPTTVLGENVVGVAKGNDDRGGVLVVGADYDTSMEHHPLEDNGAGVGVMLETARNYMAATNPVSLDQPAPFAALKTVIFVAFDLNTREYGEAEVGQPGSFHFLHQWLWPFLDQSPENLTGVIILDSITRFNQEPKSQFLPSGFEKTFPKAFEHINEGGMKGNFLAAYIRDSPSSQNLSQTFTTSYLMDRKARLVRLEELKVSDGATVNDRVLQTFNHQAQFHFWTFQPSTQPTPLPAILLTDTGIYRQPGTNGSCAVPCSASQFLSRPRRTALTIITTALTNTLLNLQSQRLPTSSSSSSGGENTDGNAAASPLFFMVATFLLPQLVHLLH
ncbi:hypothetical protein Pcinc_013281 [Petrolisthes cinctipes]|uniref:Peptidase M28 domain-containing protein n=1 Tax=Petrolisthes cinctipes TaxID=88211 RepID=A0AAE1FZF0_PETCI|nr:hypothetical protein Pcinc_013281 [Petrolisthes cinctipes]